MTILDQTLIVSILTKVALLGLDEREIDSLSLIEHDFALVIADGLSFIFLTAGLTGNTQLLFDLRLMLLLFLLSLYIVAVTW